MSAPATSAVVAGLAEGHRQHVLRVFRALLREARLMPTLNRRQYVERKVCRARWAVAGHAGAGRAHSGSCAIAGPPARIMRWAVRPRVSPPRTVSTPPVPPRCPLQARHDFKQSKDAPAGQAAELVALAELQLDNARLQRQHLNDLLAQGNLKGPR